MSSFIKDNVTEQMCINVAEKSGSVLQYRIAC